MYLSSHRPPADLLRSFDERLQQFYHDAIHREMNICDKKCVLEIKEALKEVVNAYKRENIENRVPIRFDSSAKRCAYVLKHSPCFTSAVGKYFLEVLRDKPQLLYRSMIKGELNVCCLGGGPASDVVAISKVVSELYPRYCFENGSSLNFRITIVDVNEDWEITARNVLETLKKDDKLCCTNKIHVAFQFIQADLTQTLCKAVKDVLKSADIVTMVYFLSAVNGGQDVKESFDMVQEIMKSIKPGAILFFLDSAIDVHYKQMNRSAEHVGNMANIYGPLLEEFHSLSLDSVKTFLKLYKKEFNKFMCMTSCFVSTSAWFKLEETLYMKRSIRSYSITLDAENEILARKSLLTAKMLAFRAEVQKLLIAEFDLNVVEDEVPTEDTDESEESFDSFCEHFARMPDHFFQTKSKKKRIFTGDPLLI